jgi:uncharacterized membrane protein YdjX (TVP38/TMEM64 family)
VSTEITRTRAWVRLLLAAVVLGGIAVVAHRQLSNVVHDPQALAARLRAMPNASAWFVAAYALAATLALPATPFTLAGGIIFGVAKGTALNWMAATAGATGSFLLARWLGADAVRALLGRHAARIAWLTYDASAVTIMRMRLVPVVPFDGLSVAAGLAGVPLRAFVIGTAIGIIPGTTTYAWFAQSLVQGTAGASRAAFAQLAVASLLLVGLSFLPKLVTRRRAPSPALAATDDRPCPAETAL